MRLFFLHKYGGIYIDLDIECLRSLDFLRHYGWVMPQVGCGILTHMAPRAAVPVPPLAGDWISHTLMACIVSTTGMGTVCAPPPRCQGV